MSEGEQTPELDSSEPEEAGLGDLSPEEVVALSEQVAADHEELKEAEVEDEPLDEDEVLAEDEEGGE